MRDFLLSINIMYQTLHLTENFKLKAADTLISKLRQELGAANAYIDELEEDKHNLEEQIEKLKELNKNLNDKYSRDVNEFLKTDSIYQKFVKVIDETEKNIIRLQNRNDKLVYEIMKLRDERNNQTMV